MKTQSPTTITKATLIKDIGQIDKSYWPLAWALLTDVRGDPWKEALNNAALIKHGQVIEIMFVVQKDHVYIIVEV